LRPSNITLEEIFLFGGKLQTEQPTKEDAAAAVNKKYAKTFSGKEQNPVYNKEKIRKKVKNKSQNESNKGRWRQYAPFYA
ncbi:ATP-dependent helicase, partial [Enterococcus faecium]